MWLCATSLGAGPRESGLVDAALSPFAELEGVSFVPEVHEPLRPLKASPVPLAAQEELIRSYQDIDDAREGIGISESDLASYRDAFEADPHSRMTQNALRQIDARSLSRKKLVIDHHFSHRLGMLKAMPLNQRESPRCWIFAAQRMMQMYVMHIASHGSGGDYNRRENITDGAVLSATYPLFWETYEKANAFYEEVIETAYPETHPMDEWQMREVFGDPLPRGGTWPLYQQLFLKYGAVPEKAMPETWASTKTDDMFALIQMMLREGGFELREAAQALVAKRARGSKKKRGRKLATEAAERAAARDLEALRKQKMRLLEPVHRQLVVHLGMPPERFNWTFNTVSGMQHTYVELTPQTFAFDVVPFRADNLLYIQHDPRHEYWKLYTHKGPRSSFMAGWRYSVLNAPMAYIEQLTTHSLLRGHPVWFAADVGADSSVGQGRSNVLDKGLFEYEQLLGVPLNLSKAERIAYLQSYATHAMLFTGVDVDANFTVSKFHVDNSWGDAAGSLSMSTEWFREYVFYIAIDKSFLHPSVLKIFEETEPVELESWDTMGAQQSLCGGHGT